MRASDPGTQIRARQRDRRLHQQVTDARRQVSAARLREALAVLIGLPAPPATLAASASDLEYRIQRLTSSTVHPRRCMRVRAAGMTLIGVVTPMAVAALAGLAIASAGLCLLH